MSQSDASSKPSVETLLADLEAKEFRTKNEAIKKLARYRDENVVKRLTEISRSSDWSPSLRVQAINSLSRNLRRPEFIKFAKELFKSEKNVSEVRRACITHLARYRDKDLVSLFQEALKDEYRFIRFWALRGLIKLHDPKAVSAIIDALGDQDEEIRKEASNHLRAMGEEIVAPLEKALKRQSNNKFLRYGIIGILGRLGVDAALPSLLNALKDGNDRVVVIALRSIAKLKLLNSIKPLLKFYETKVDLRPQIINTLYKIGKGQEKQFVIELAKIYDPSNNTIADAIIELVEKYSPESQLYLTDALGYKSIDDEVKEQIQMILDIV